MHKISGDAVNDLVTLFASEGLPIEDVAEPERRFFAFSETQTATSALGVLERGGGDMLLRSVVTMLNPAWSEHGRVITLWLVEEAE